VVLMGRKKSADMTQILMVCAIGMITLFAGLVVSSVLQSNLAPDVTVGKADVVNIIKSEKNDAYEIAFSVKNNEKRSVKAELKIKIGFDVYRMRHSTSPKPNFYRFFQVLSESKNEVILPPRADQKVQATLVVGQDTYKKYEIKPDTKIYSRVAAEKVSWGDEFGKTQA